MNDNLFVAKNPITQSYWVKNEGFVAEVKEHASLLTAQELNTLKFHFYRLSVVGELVS